MAFSSKSQGFTLIELMVVLGILVAMLTVAVPNFMQFTRNTQMQSKAEEVEAIFRYARSQAVVERKTYEVRIDNATTWSVWQANALEPERNIEFSLPQATPRITNLTNNRWIFDSSGVVRQAGSVILCRDQDFERGRLIEVQASGMVNLNPPGKKPDNSPLTSCTP